ncbi:DEAD/DEAH box helicase, putative [Hepatocystis sp. ex Piliocolobus tephrosceles]|nr:DEAD/DEAH box helicase, putative [Hepatocystis sp. ex Piliocolobus tephrosceles]
MNNIRTRINSKVKRNSYETYCNKNLTNDIEEAISYIKQNEFFQKYADSLIGLEPIYKNSKKRKQKSENELAEKIKEIVKKETEYIKKYLKKSKKHAKDVKDVKHAKDVKDVKHAKDVKDVKHAKDVKDVKHAKHAKDAKYAKHAKDAKHAKHAKDAKDTKQTKDMPRKKKETGLMHIYNLFESLLNDQNTSSEQYLFITKEDNSIKKIYMDDMKELLTEVIYILLTEENDIENSLLNLLGANYIELIIAIIQNKKEIEKDMALLSKHVDIKENVPLANFLIKNVTKDKKINKKKSVYKKKNLEKILEYFLNALKDNAIVNQKLIYIPGENNKLKDIAVPQNTTYTHINNITKVKIDKLPNFEYNKNELIPVTALPFWHTYIFDFEYFNYIQSKVFKAAYKSNKNLLVSAPTGCGKTNIAMLVVLQQIMLFAKQNHIDLSNIVKSNLNNMGMTYIDEEETNKYGRNESGTNESGTNKYGTNKYGTNESGHNESGRNGSGHNESGTNKYGTNESGRNGSGRNESGTNKYGTNESGHNEIGTNKYGTNESGHNDSGRNGSGTNTGNNYKNDNITQKREYILEDPDAIKQNEDMPEDTDAIKQNEDMPEDTDATKQSENILEDTDIEPKKEYFAMSSESDASIMSDNDDMNSLNSNIILKQNTYINANEFKIIYIAPMKSLVYEITNIFKSKLKIFNLKVCEYTKEHSLSGAELKNVHIIVTVPEKLDILLRNSNYSTTVSDESLIKCIKCIILDEIHLLNTDRGDVIETIVARFLRYSETSQSIKRVMAMSATLPNYKDVSAFLKVSNDMCFFFNEKYRSIQLDKTLYGIHEKSVYKLNIAKNTYAYDEIIESLKKNKQCIIFVCSRNETHKTIDFLINYAKKNQELHYFTNDLYRDSDVHKKINRSDNMYIKNFFKYGCTIHHAGMSRYDKILVENLFKKKVFNVLCCTSTLAWGVNLPVHTVIIKGTNYFSAESGKIEDMDILNINQIFGRCGRPQYESHGHAVLITEGTKLYHYIRLLTNNTIIESNLLKNIENHLNAEISIGTTKNVEDAISWLEYTYLFVRMNKNPYLYGVDPNDINLYNKRKEIILKAVTNLTKNRLVRRVLLTNQFISTFYGQIAAKYYVDYTTVGLFASHIEKNTSVDIIKVISQAKEFENIQIRNEDMKDFLYYKQKCEIKQEYDESKAMTIQILIKIYLSRIVVTNFSLICEINFIVQNIIRILYAYYEICLNVLKNISYLIMKTHNLILAILRRLPLGVNIFRHFCYRNELVDKRLAAHKDIVDDTNENNDNITEQKSILSNVAMKKIQMMDTNEDTTYLNNRSSHYKKNQSYPTYLKEAAVNILEKKNLSYDNIANLTKSELFFFLKNEMYVKQILYYKNIIPNLEIDGYIQPINQTIIKINLNIQLVNTVWSNQWNNTQEEFHLFLFNTLDNDILYFQKFKILKKDRKKIHDISFQVPLSEELPPQLTVHFLSMNWCNLSYVHIFNTNNIFINQRINTFSRITSAIPLSTQILYLPSYIKFFSFKYFNPIQTQVFHAAFHTDENLLMGAPTGTLFL